MNGLLEPIISMYSMLVMPLRNHNTYYYIEGVLRPLLSPSCIIIIHLTNNKGYNRHELPAQAAPLRLHQADQLPDPVLRLPHHHLQHLQQAAGQSSQRPQLPQHSRPPGQRLTVLLSTAASSPSTPLPRCQGMSLHKSASDRNINIQSRVYQRMYQARLGDAGERPPPPSRPKRRLCCRQPEYKTAHLPATRSPDGAAVTMGPALPPSVSLQVHLIPHSHSHRFVANTP